MRGVENERNLAVNREKEPTTSIFTDLNLSI